MTGAGLPHPEARKGVTTGGPFPDGADLGIVTVVSGTVKVGGDVSESGLGGVGGVATGAGTEVSGDFGWGAALDIPGVLPPVVG